LESVTDLVRSLKAIREPRQRVFKFVEKLEPRDPAEIAKLLWELTAPPAETDRESAQIHLDLVRYHELLNRLGYEKLTSVYHCAAQAEYQEVLWLLRSDRIRSGAAEEMPEGFVAKIESLTLGQRKALSRSLKKSSIEFLLFDPDPSVIRELLLNPRITEREAVRIAARHHASPNVIRQVLKSDRWMANYRVRKALAFNPATPKSYVPGLIRHLHRQDLRLLLQSGRHDTEIQRLVRARLKRT
jgi:hypothetical protein